MLLLLILGNYDQEKVKQLFCYPQNFEIRMNNWKEGIVFRM